MKEITLELIYNTLVQFKQETNTRFDNIEEHLAIVDERLDGIDKHLAIVDERLDGIDKHLAIVDGRLDGIDKHLAIVDGRLDGIEEHLAIVDGRLDGIDERFDRNEFSYNARFEAIENRLTALENITTKIEYEHGRKLDLLLDYAKASIEKHEQYDKYFLDIHTQLLEHDTRIEILEEAFSKA